MLVLFSKCMILEALFTGAAIFCVEAVRTFASEFVTEVVYRWKNSRNKAKPDAQQNSFNVKTAQATVQDLETIDAEIVELERKARRDGSSSRADQDRQQELEQQRAEKFKQYEAAKSEEILSEQAENAENYTASVLSSDRVHVLQYHMGQVVLEKKCSACQRPMILQSRQRLDGSLYRLEDFFWSCTGYFNPAHLQCRGTQPFRKQDSAFLHKTNVLELTVSNADLSSIFESRSVQNAVVERVKSHVKEKDQEIMCSIHHVPMTLRERREHSGAALDMFFLGCPHPGCQQTVKLKSAAQLAAYLQRKEGRGIL